MNMLAELRSRFRPVLAGLANDVAPLLEMIRPAQDARFGDYQANCAMPLGKRLGRPPRDVAGEILAGVELSDLCESAEIAGPGFINLRLHTDRLRDELQRALCDERLGVAVTDNPQTYVVDFSSPNVAKPMHVGHIRSTVIGDALCRLLRFLGHTVIGDNHLGDWGTQFGMIIYGYRHFAHEAAYRAQPVAELTRAYQLVRRLMDYHEGQRRLPTLVERVAEQQQVVDEARGCEAAAADKAEAKKAKKEVRRLQGQLDELRTQRDALRAQLESIDGDPALSELARRHEQIGAAVLDETARLHADDPDNLALWRQFLPHCRDEINRIYRRLGVTFDEELGESFYHDRLAGVVNDFLSKKLATQSDGAICVFTGDSDVPMIIRKKDGAYLYATTDLATIQYRLERWQPDAILYVVDHRQGLHFQHLFAAARAWLKADAVELTHVSFGTVLGDDGRPFRTRAGDTVGLEGLLDEAVRRALVVVSANDDAREGGPVLSDTQRQRIAEVVGIAALKYADLSQNRTSDYVFSYDKMLNLNGNTATYMQYAYARVQSIFARGQVDAADVRTATADFSLDQPEERALALAILQFEEALALAVADYRPNQLTNYLFQLADKYSAFFHTCPVLKAETAALRASRLGLCDLTARTLKQGLELLGIEVIEKM